LQNCIRNRIDYIGKKYQNLQQLHLSCTGYYKSVSQSNILIERELIAALSQLKCINDYQVDVFSYITSGIVHALKLSNIKLKKVSFYLSDNTSVKLIFQNLMQVTSAQATKSLRIHYDEATINDTINLARQFNAFASRLTNLTEVSIHGNVP
jgi:hypothetical protein